MEYSKYIDHKTYYNMYIFILETCTIIVLSCSALVNFLWGMKQNFFYLKLQFLIK